MRTLVASVYCAKTFFLESSAMTILLCIAGKYLYHESDIGKLIMISIKAKLL